MTTNLLFPGKRPDRAIDLRKLSIKVLKEAGIMDFRFHDLRHSAATHMAMSGSSLTEIEVLLGHKHLDLSKRYTHLTEKHLSKAVEEMNEEIFDCRFLTIPRHSKGLCDHSSKEYN